MPSILEKHFLIAAAMTVSALPFVPLQPVAASISQETSMNCSCTGQQAPPKPCLMVPCPEVAMQSIVRDRRAINVAASGFVEKAAIAFLASRNQADSGDGGVQVGNGVKALPPDVHRTPDGSIVINTISAT